MSFSKFPATQLQRTPPSALPPQKFQNWIQHQIRMNALKAERDRLQTRQREIRRVSRGNSTSYMTINQFSFYNFFPLYFPQNDIMSRTRLADPFLPAAGVMTTTPVEHNRQGSADSGLGMGNNYSLPPTPEDFLNSIDDYMDGVTGMNRFFFRMTTGHNTDFACYTLFP